MIMDKEIIIKNFDQVIFDRLKFEADRQGVDIKTVIIQLIKKSLGLEKISDKNADYHDLDNLAGTWTIDEFNDFSSNTNSFNQIDENLWK